jgi:hypothetical protein
LRCGKLMGLRYTVSSQGIVRINSKTNLIAFRSLARKQEATYFELQLCFF